MPHKENLLLRKSVHALVIPGMGYPEGEPQRCSSVHQSLLNCAISVADCYRDAILIALGGLGARQRTKEGRVMEGSMTEAQRARHYLASQNKVEGFETEMERVRRARFLESRPRVSFLYDLRTESDSDFQIPPSRSLSAQAFNCAFIIKQLKGQGIDIDRVTFFNMLNDDDISPAIFERGLKNHGYFGTFSRYGVETGYEPENSHWRLRGPGNFFAWYCLKKGYRQGEKVLGRKKMRRLRNRVKDLMVMEEDLV